MPDSVLVNYMSHRAVGHLIEGLRHCLAYKVADPSRSVSVVLNEGLPLELADVCPFVDQVHPVPSDQPPEAGLARVAGEWDWVVDDPRRAASEQLKPYPWLEDYYATSDRLLRTRRGRGLIGGPELSYSPHQRLRLELPEDSRRRARELLGDGVPAIAVMPTGSGARWTYPSLESWQLVVRALRERHSDSPIVITGKLAQGGGSSSSFTRAELDTLLASCPGTVEAFDLGLLNQLAVIERCGLFVSSHTGFGMAVLSVGTPWLTLSGGLWHEYFCNGVPFYSVQPDPSDYRAYSGLKSVLPRPGGDGLRMPSMSRARVESDLGELLDAADRLLSGEIDYAEAEAGHFNRLLDFYGGDPDPIWSFEDVHRRHIQGGAGIPPPAQPTRALVWLSRVRHRSHI